MEQTVYIDVLFIVNVFVNYFLLRATGRIIKSETKKIRILLGALLGALYAVIIFFVDAPVWVVTLSKLVFACSVTLLVFGRMTIPRFVKTVCAFLSVTFLFAGLFFACWFFLAPAGMDVNNGVVYVNISPLLLAALTGLGYGLTILLHRLYKKSLPENTKLTVQVGYQNRSAEFSAILDTGHNLTELFSGYDVIVCEYNAVAPVLDEELRGLFLSIYKKEQPRLSNSRFRLIPLDTVSGPGLLPAFRPDFVSVNGRKTREVYVAACEEKVSSGEFSGLVNPNLGKR